MGQVAIDDCCDSSMIRDLSSQIPIQKSTLLGLWIVDTLSCQCLFGFVSDILSQLSGATSCVTFVT